MRKLMWFSIGFAAACAAGAYLYSGALLYILGICLLLLSVFGLWLFCEKIALKAMAVLLCGVAVGFLAFQIYDDARLAPAREADGQSVTMRIQATDYSFENDYGVTVDGTAVLNGQSYAVRAYIHDQTPISPGQIIEGTFRLRYTATGGKNAPTHHSGAGVFLLAYPTGEHTVSAQNERSWRYLPAHLRKTILQKIEQVFPEDTEGFAKALLLGDTTGLDYATDTELKLSGIRHVVAVSGLHVSILFSAVYLLAGKRRVLSALLGVPVLVLFAAMAGFTPSILRACMMQVLMLVALLCRKEYDPPTALSFAVLAILAANPLTITSVGFQLSVGSVAGIFLFSQRIQKWLVDPKRLGRMKGRGILNRLIHGAAASVSISLGTMVTTTPLCAWYFGTVSLIGILTNLLCLWVVTFIFCGIILACFAGMLWMPLAAAGAWLLSWPIRYILTVAAWLSRFPLAAVYTQSVYVRAWLVFCYVLLGIFLVSKHKRPVVLACCAVLSLCVTLLASWTEPLLDEYRVTVLDVGQGQCVLLQSQGKTYMVDCGGEYNVSVADKAAAYLNSQGIFGLDGLIVTHYDEDHVGAAAYLMSRVPVRQLIAPVGVGNEDWIETLSDVYGDEPIYALEDLQLQWGEALLTVYASNDLSTSNESSLCVLFHTEKYDILITGDRTDAGERMLLAGHRLPELDALIVGHHGAASSTGRTLLEKTRPKVAVISVGADNRYDHPSVETLERLHTYGCWIRRTDLEGTIILRG